MNRHDPEPDALMERVRAADPASERSATPLPFSTILSRIDEPVDRRASSATRRTVHSGRGRRVRFGVAAVCTVGVAVFAALALPIGDRTHLDVVAEARAALNLDGGGILHVVTTTTTTSSGEMVVLGPDGKTVKANRTERRYERWSTSDPDRFHDVMTMPGPGRRSETDYAVRRFRNVAPDGVVHSHTGTAREIKTVLPTVMALSALQFGLGGSGVPTDVVAAIRKLLADGQVKAAGETQLRGRTVVRLVSVPPADPQARPPGTRVPPPAVYFVDAATYAPVRVTMTSFYMPAPHAPAQTLSQVTDFLTYERLSLNEDTERLLEIDTTGKEVVDDPTMFVATAHRMRQTAAQRRQAARSNRAPRQGTR